MSADKKMLFLKTIAEAKKMAPEEVLAALISRDLIYAPVENVTLSSPMVSMAFAITDLPIPEMYLNIILSRGTWEGNRIQIRAFDVEAVGYYVTEATFDKQIRLSRDDLFVYEPDLVELEKLNPDIFAKKPVITSKEEETLYALVGIFLDMLVDKKGKNILPLPNVVNKYIFKNQAGLIAHIEKYEIYGLQKSSLEDKFSKANSALNSKNKA